MSSSKALRSLDTNTISTKASQQPVKGPHGVHGFSSGLPIPFVNGKPVDYRTMNVDQLKCFINFLFKCKYENDLPISAKEQNRNQALPQWWPPKVSFEKSLKVRDVLTGPKGLSEQQKALVALVYSCYSYFGSLSFLAIGLDLANSVDNKSMWIDRNDSEKLWKVVGHGDKTLIIVDAASVTYDSTNGPKLRERSSTTTEKEGADFDFPDSNSPRTQKPLVRSGAKKPKPGNKSSKNTKRKPKRKLYEIEEDDEPVKPVACKYCGKSFNIPEFCDDHEAQCTKGPKSNLTIQSFMGALGMQDRAEIESRPTESSTLRSSPVPSVSSGRSARKLPKKNHILSVIKNNPIPITSERGLRLIAENGEKATPTYPPAYERDCRSRTTGKRSIAEKEYPNVMKKVIAKDAINPHVYSYGRSQRLDRYQEIAIGVNKKSFPALNKLKTPQLVLTRMKPIWNTINVSTCTKKSYLERQFRAAIEFPRVRIVDISKNITPEVAKYLKPADKAVIERKKITSEVAEHSKKKEAVIEKKTTPEVAESSKKSEKDSMDGKKVTSEVAEHSKKKEHGVIERKRKMTPEAAESMKKVEKESMERKKVTSQVAEDSKKKKNVVIVKKMTPEVAKSSKKVEKITRERRKMSTEAASSSNNKVKAVMEKKTAKAPSPPSSVDSILSDSSCSSSSSGSLFVPVAKKRKPDVFQKINKK